MLLKIATMLPRPCPAPSGVLRVRAGCAAVLLLAAGLAPGCQRSPPLLAKPTTVPSGQTLQVLAFPDYFGKTTLPRFEAETGNKVVLGTYATSEELLQRLAHDTTAYDVIFPSSYAVERLLREGKLLPMQRERVPNLVHVSTEFRNPHFDPSLAHCAPYDWWAAGLGFVWSKDGPSRQPDSLKDLFGPTGERVVWLDDMRATLGLALRMLGHSASTQQGADLLEAQQLLLAALPRVDALVRSPGALLRSGQARLSLAWSTEIYNLHRERDDIRFAVAQEGALLYVDYACVPIRAKHPEVAFAFINHLLDPQVSAEITNLRMLPMPNEAARRLLEGEGRTMWGLFEFLRNHNRSYETLVDVGAAQPAYDQTWKTIKDAMAAQKARRAIEAASPRAPAKSPDKAPSKSPDKAPSRSPGRSPGKSPGSSPSKSVTPEPGR